VKVMGMDPVMASQVLRIIAQKIDLSRSNSISEVTSELKYVLQCVSSETQTSASDGWIKGLKRKILNTKEEKKILDRIDYLNSLMSLCDPVSKKIRNHESMVDIFSDDDCLRVLESSAKFIVNGSSILNMIKIRNIDIISALADLDDHWAENEGDEEEDRDVIVDSISELYSKCETRIQNNERRLSLMQSKKTRSSSYFRHQGNSYDYDVI